MGLEIRKDKFAAAEFEAFRERLNDNLSALDQLLQRPEFGQGEMSIGAELEMSFVRADGEPALINQELLAVLDDARYTPEINRFNLEFNAQPRALAGRPFAAMSEEMSAALNTVAHHAGPHGAEPAIVGILPTLAERHLAPEVMTPLARYRALNHALRELRGRPFRLSIDGEDPLRCAADDVTFEGANTSFQLHLRVPPKKFARVFNAAQMATAPVLAVAGNSPFFLHHRLWEETRIVVFKQSVDDRADQPYHHARTPRVGFGIGWMEQGAAEYFRYQVETHPPLIPVCDDDDPLAAVAAGRVPGLAELRMHNGTVWTWNRPIFDPSAGGHLRIEFRSLPSGPTVADMTANAALLLGLSLGLAEQGPDPLREFPFAAAHRNFYRAAQGGLGAILDWPDGYGETAPITAWDLLGELLPVAAQGLLVAGVERSEVDRQLAVIEGRLETAQTGSAWQRQAVADLGRSLPRADALAAMFRRYMHHSQANLPVFQWPRI